MFFFSIALNTDRLLRRTPKTKIINDLQQQITIVSPPFKSNFKLNLRQVLKRLLMKTAIMIQRRTNLVSDNDDFLTWSSTVTFENKTQLTIDATVI
jgi:hypothetical protein